MKKILLQMFILFLVLNGTLLGSSVESIEISLDSFGSIGTVIMIVLSTLLGAFFMKDEFSSM